MDRLLRSTQTNISAEDYTTVTVDEQQDWVVAIEDAKYAKAYVLWLKFNDGREIEVDFEPFLSNSLNPHIRKYLDLDLFKQFTLADSDLYWDDYDLCFPIAALYEGHI